MTAHLVVRTLSISDPARYEEYRRVAAPIVARYGGRYIVRGSVEKTLEGDHEAQRITVIEFEDEAQLLRFWTSSEYEAARKIRLAAGRLQVGCVAGFDGR